MDDIDVTNVCRTCLKSENLIDLLPNNSSMADIALESMRNAVESCYGIQMRSTDELSKKLCRDCIKLVSLFKTSLDYAKSANTFLMGVLINQQVSTKLLGEPITSVSRKQGLVSTSKSPVPLAGREENSTVSNPRSNSSNSLSPSPTKVIGTTIDESNILEPATKRSIKLKYAMERRKQLKKILVQQEKILRLANAKTNLKRKIDPNNEDSSTLVNENITGVARKRGRPKRLDDIQQNSNGVSKKKAPFDTSREGSPRIPKGRPKSGSVSEVLSNLNVLETFRGESPLTARECDSLSDTDKRASSGRIIKPVGRMEL